MHTKIDTYESINQQIKKALRVKRHNEGWVEVHDTHCNITNIVVLKDYNVHIIFSYEEKIMGEQKTYRLVAHICRSDSEKPGKDAILCSREYEGANTRISQTIKMTAVYARGEMHLYINFDIEDKSPSDNTWRHNHMLERILVVQLDNLL